MEKMYAKIKLEGDLLVIYGYSDKKVKGEFIYATDAELAMIHPDRIIERIPERVESRRPRK